MQTTHLLCCDADPNVVKLVLQSHRVMKQTNIMPLIKSNVAMIYLTDCSEDRAKEKKIRLSANKLGTDVLLNCVKYL